MVDCACGRGVLRFIAAVENKDEGRLIFRCDACGAEFEQEYYRYTPSTCPKHQWQFESWGFFDSCDNHEIYWNLKCDRCGLKTKKRWDSRAVGLKEAVDIEDPRVLNLLELNRYTKKYLLGKTDEETDFWH